MPRSDDGYENDVRFLVLVYAACVAATVALVVWVVLAFTSVSGQ